MGWSGRARAFEENLTHCKRQIPALFWFNTPLIASNRTDKRPSGLFGW
jgi:hypothetical protein